MNDYESIIFSTKLKRPPPPDDFVQRSNLFTELDKYCLRQLTLVSAAAGYGKSSLISSWLEKQECRFSWLSLDESQNNIRDFVCYLVASVHSVFPASLQETKRLVCQSQLPSIKYLSSSLINELDLLEEPLIITMDDLHLIHETLVQELLSDLLKYIPKNIHLILISRNDPFLPISKMRLEGAVTEIRAGDLEFSPEETQIFLNNTTSHQVDFQTAKDWTIKTEGWVTGLRMATLTLDTSTQELTKDPYLSWKSRELAIEYMLQEILTKLDSGTVVKLLLSSITDSFSPSLCDALFTVLEGENSESISNGAEFIASMRKLNLFVIPLDNENKWFRYHHLFQDLLHEEMIKQFTPKLINAAHRKVSEWFNNNGFYNEATKHAISSNDNKFIVRTFEQVSRTITANGNWFALKELLFKLPESVLVDNKEFLFSKAMVTAYAADLNNLHELTNRLEALNSYQKENDYSAEIALCRGFYSLYTTGMDKQLVNFQVAMDGIDVSDAHIRHLTELAFAFAGYIDGQKDHVIRTFDQTINEMTSTESARLPGLYLGLAHIHLMSFSLTTAKMCIDRGWRSLGSLQTEHFSVIYNWLEGQVHLAKGEYEKAIPFQKLAVNCRYTHSNHWRTAIDNLTSLAITFQLIGQSDKADSALDNLREYTANLPPASAIFVSSCEARLLLLRGETHQACAWLEMTGSVDYELFFHHLVDLPAVTYCRVLIAKGGASNLDAAEAKLLNIIDFAESTNNNFQLIMTLPVLAQVYNMKEDTQATDLLLNKALYLAEPEGVIFPFLELGASLATALKRQILQGKVSKKFIEKIEQHLVTIKKVNTNQLSDKSTNLTLLSPLTKREIEVLNQLKLGLYQKEIAAKLFVSPETIKSHLKNIYKKLKVHGRREAIKHVSALNIEISNIKV